MSKPPKTVPVPNSLLTLDNLSGLGRCLKYSEQLALATPDVQVLYDLFLQHVPKQLSRRHKNFSLHRDRYTEKQFSWLRWDRRFAPPYEPRHYEAYGVTRLDTDRGPYGGYLETDAAVWYLLCYWQTETEVPGTRNTQISRLYYGIAESPVADRIWCYLLLAAHLPYPVWPEVDYGPESTR